MNAIVHRTTGFEFTCKNCGHRHHLISRMTFFCFAAAARCTRQQPQETMLRRSGEPEQKATLFTPGSQRKSRLRRKVNDEEIGLVTTSTTDKEAVLKTPPASASRPKKSVRRKRGSTIKSNDSILSMTTALLALSCCFALALMLMFVLLMRIDTPDVQIHEILQQGEQRLKGELQRREKQIFDTTQSILGRSPGLEHRDIAPDHAVQTIRKDETNVIDMRELNYQLPFTNEDGGAWKQGWDVQPVSVSAEQPLTVYVIPHSHCDPGWLKTFDQYFQTQTKNIITTVIQALAKDKKRKFIWAEISYFAWWWDEQNETTRQLVKELLKKGQLEFVTAGWVQPDEANSELYAMEMQLQEGHSWIRENLGEEAIPKYAWAIDPFGYSPSAAWLWQKYGFRAMLIQRVHYAIKKELARKKHLEFYWRQTWDEHGDHDIFTHVMPFFSYDIPHTCGPDPSVCCQFDFKRGRGECPWRKDPIQITSNNVAERAMLLWDQYKKKAALYRSNTVLVPLGDDFRYQSTREAEAQYENYQRIFDYLNSNVPGAHVQFGTLSDYFKAVMGTFDTPLLLGSFFTYSDVREDYWSGYFTSRAFDKALDRQLERVLYAAESMGGTALELRGPRRELSLFQHHDGVTGTAKTSVVEDYARRMFGAIDQTHEWILAHIKKSQTALVTKLGGSLKPCVSADEPRDLSTNHCSGDVLIYNPLDTPQKCAQTTIEGRAFGLVKLPCEIPGKVAGSHTVFEFDPKTGLMNLPIKEEWKIWKVKKGGAYLFVPGAQSSYDMEKIHIKNHGLVIETENWKRTVVEKEVPTEYGTTATVIDFIYEVNLNTDNEEWFVRFGADIQNEGYFHTDLNGFNFDTHHFRSDMPIQSQVFPMPTLASIDDDKLRLTVISEHAQGTASLQDGTIDVWLDRRLRQDDNRGLGQGVQDNRLTRTRFRVVLERDGYKHGGEFDVTSLTRRMWDELQHPLEMYGQVSP